MPYKRTNYSRRYNRRRYSSRMRTKGRPNIKQMTFRNVQNMTLGQAAYGAMKGFNMLKGIINSEMKRYDFSLGTAIDNTGLQTFTINGIAQGDNVDQRNGNSILAKYLTVAGTISLNSAATDTNIRMLVFVDTMPSSPGNVPAIADILQNFTPEYNITSPINVDNTDRFTVLYDRKFVLSSQNNRSVIFKKYIPLNFHIKFNGTTDTSFDKNSIYIMFVADEVTNEPVFSLNTRLAYYDN